MQNNKLICSILLSVHNGEETLSQCLSSIAAQTYTDYEIIIIDDASTDATPNIISHWQEHFKQPITLITHKKNQGLTKSLNEGMKIAQGKYIARIDADDQWHSEKLEKQIDYLQTHPKIGVLGTWYLNATTKNSRTIKTPPSDSEIRHTIYRRNPFGHSTVIMRKKILTEINGYNELLRFGQDRDLWFRLLNKTEFANIPKVLCYRDISSTSTNKRQQIIQSIKTTSRYIRAHHAPITNYVYLVEPIVIMITPSKIRHKIRQIRTR